MSFGFGYRFWHAEILNFYMSKFNSLLCFLDFMCHLERLSPFLGFPCGSAGKESTCGAGDLGSTPGLGRSPGEGKGYPLQYSGLENSMDRGTWWAQSPWGRKESDITEPLTLSLSSM